MRLMARAGLFLLLLSLSAVGVAQLDLRSNQTFGYFGVGQSFEVLGSRDRRFGQELGAQNVGFEPRFGRYKRHFRTVETAYMLHHSGTDFKYGRTQVYGLGAMYGLRGLFGPDGRYFLEYSFGLMVDSRRSHGVPSEANVTPAFLLGETTGGLHPVEIALQLMHISNGYTQRPNFGLDFATLVLGIKL